MKILLPYSKTPKTGKGKFMLRLCQEWARHGIEVVAHPAWSKDADIYMDYVRFRFDVRNYDFGDDKALDKGIFDSWWTNKPRVLRLNGLYNDLDRPSAEMNKPIQKALQLADAVVYQSRFSKTLCDKYIGEPKCPWAIIGNGVDPAYYAGMKPIKTEYKHTFITASRWRPHKRLDDIIESFRLADIPDSCLVIAGEDEQTRTEKRIKHIGRVDDLTLSQYLVGGTAFIHLCWQDNCPNSVVEAICAGLPVICNNVGGTAEIVAPSGGTVAMVDPEYDYEMCHLYKPPPIDHRIIADAMWDIVKRPPVVKSDHITIETIARQYKAFLEGVL